MKQRILSFALTLVLLLSSLLSGCGILPGGSPSTDTAAGPVTTDPPSADSGTEQTAAPIPETEPPSTPYYAEIMENGFGMFPAFPFDLDDFTFCTGGKAAAVHTVPDNSVCQLALLDVTSGECLTAEYVFPASEDPDAWNYADVFQLGGYTVLCDMRNGHYISYDDTLSPVCTVDAPIELYTASQLSDDTLFIISSYGNCMLLRVGEDGTLDMQTVDVGTGEELWLYGARGMLPDGRILLVGSDTTDWEQVFGFYDAQASVFTPLCVDPSALDVRILGDTVALLSGNPPAVTLYDAATPHMVRTMYTAGGATPVETRYDTRYLYYYSATDSALELMRYSTEDGALSASVLMPRDDPFLFASRVSEENGLVYFYFYDGDGYRLCVWEPTPTEHADEDPYALLKENSSSVTRDNSRLAARLSAETGITIRYGVDADVFFSGYAVRAENDPYLIRDALGTLERFFDRLPDGFLAELLDEFYTMSIYLTGRLMPDTYSSSSIGDAAAFTTESNRYAYIVIDITTSSLDRTVAHEFMHLIDHAVWYMKYEDGRDDLEAFARWPLLNPSDFRYSESYKDGDGRTLDYLDSPYTASFAGEDADIDELYFVDGYATTYMKEDMARFFEYLCTCGDELPSYFYGKGMQTKAAYLCLCLRQAFRSLDGCETAPWEEGIHTDATLEDYIGSYDLSLLAAG